MPTTMSKTPELSPSDLQWLEKAIGIGMETLSNDVLKTADYVQAIETHLATNPQCSLNAKNPHGNTPLHLIAISENYSAIEALLKCGADVNETNNLGQTPATFSHNCPDYAVGFQFYRHLHKLAFLGQHVHKENSVWKYDVGELYDSRYRIHGHLTAFMHNPSLTTEAISRIDNFGERAVYGMYEKELENMRNARTRKRRTLDKVAKITDKSCVAVNRLKELKRFTNNRKFHKNFPVFGCVVMMKYRQALEAQKSNCDGEEQRPVDENESYARQLRNEDESRMEEFTARDNTVMVGLMNGLKIDEERKQERDCDGSVGQSQVPVDEASSDEKLERMRRNLARLPGRRA